MILLYRGNSLLSRAIMWFNWGDYSHAAYQNERTGEVIEAWKGGVRLVDGPMEQHEPGTEIDFFDFVEPLTEGEELMIWHDLQKEVGKPYDYGGIFHFVFRTGSQDKGEWFCSELVFAKVNPIRKLLNHVPAHKVYPSMLAMPTALRLVGGMKDGSTRRRVTGNL